MVDFGRALRQTGIPVDSQRISLAQRALTLVDLSSKESVCDALLACMLSRIEDRSAFLLLFDVWFGDAKRLETRSIDLNEGDESALAGQSALIPTQACRSVSPATDETTTGGMSALQRLSTADFATLTPAELAAVARLASQRRLRLPTLWLRRTMRHPRKAVLDWRETMRYAQAADGELLDLGWRLRRRQTQPLLVLIDTSGSMAAYARITLACLHSMTWGLPLRVFAMGHQLSELTPAFRGRDTDGMLRVAGQAITDYAGGTRLATCIDALRIGGRALVGGRRPHVVIISDGLDTGSPDDLRAAMGWLKSHARRVVWLNPLMRYADYQPLARGPSVMEAHVDTRLAGHNLASFYALSQALLRVRSPRCN